VERKSSKIIKAILTLAMCCSILTIQNGSVQAAQEPYTRVNPVVTITQLEKVLKQTGITVYTNKEKQEMVTRTEM